MKSVFPKLEFEEWKFSVFCYLNVISKNVEKIKFP